LSEDGALFEAGETSFALGDADAPAALARLLLDRAPPLLRALFA
jgi:hypothetical protein